MVDPGVYLVNSTGDMTPLDVDGGVGDGELFTDVIEENTHSHKCPLCQSTIRATNVEYLYFDDGTGDDAGMIVTSDLRASLPRGADGESEQLHYCPNDDCRIERLTPGGDD